MRHGVLSAFGVALVGALFYPPATGAASLVGEWKLVEQTYGQGRSNLVRPGEPELRLEFLRDGSGIRGVLRAGGVGATALSWPRLVADDTRSPRIVERRVSAGEDRIVVRYRVDPAPGDDLVLEVTEEYGAADDDRILTGTVQVRFERAGQDHGSYVLPRRFERVR